MSINSTLKAALGSGWDDVDWYWNHYCAPQKPWWQQDDNYNTWQNKVLTYTPIVYPSQIVDKTTGETTETISFDVPGCSAEQIKVSWNKDTRTLVLTGINEKLGRTFTFSINTFSQDLIEDSLITIVENGVATVSGKLKKIEKKLKVMDIPVK